MGRLIQPSTTAHLRTDVKRASTRVARLARNRRFSELEVDRYVADLGLANRRLVSREYQQSTFQPRNALRIPDRTEELFSDLTFYWSVGKVWEAIIKTVPLATDARVAEVGCGYVPKVAVGLHYADFRGTVDLLDTDDAALTHAERFLEMVGARCTPQTKQTTLFDETVGGYDALLANHLLDDLILARYCKQHGIESAQLYQREDLYAAVWNQIVASHDLLAHFVPALAAALLKLVKPGGVVVFLDYPSFSHRALGLHAVIDTVRAATRQLRAYLRTAGATVLEDLPVAPLTFDRLTVTKDDVVAFRKGGGDDAV